MQDDLAAQAYARLKGKYGSDDAKIKRALGAFLFEYLGQVKDTGLSPQQFMDGYDFDAATEEPETRRALIEIIHELGFWRAFSINYLAGLAAALSFPLILYASMHLLFWLAAIDGSPAELLHLLDAFLRAEQE